MPIYAQPTPDENLVAGWNVQGNVNPGGETGYAQAAITGTATNVGQASAGFPQPAGAMNANPSENSVAYSESVLQNGSYSVSPTTQIGQTVSWTGAAIPATTVAKVQPFATSALLTVTGGTVTDVKYTPLGSATAVDLGATAVNASIPAGATVTLTYSVVPTSVAFISAR